MKVPSYLSFSYVHLTVIQKFHKEQTLRRVTLNLNRDWIIAFFDSRIEAIPKVEMLWTGSLQSRHMQEKKSNFFATFFNAATLHSMIERWRYTSLEYTSEMCHAIISGIITKKAPVIYWPVFFSPSLVTVIRPRHFHQSPNIAFTFKFSNLYVSVSFFFFF